MSTKVRISRACVLVASLGLWVLPAISQSKCSSPVTDVVWLHSYEEDHNGTQVFRPGSFAFPPSRGWGAARSPARAYSERRKFKMS
jgi:hypothetical protein